MDSEAAQRLLREIAEWRPAGEVVSAYVAIDPADRGEGWRIELKNQVGECDGAVAERILARFAEDEALPHGRTQVGFVELDGQMRERWHGFQMTTDRTRVVQSRAPYLEPLARIVDDGWPLGVVLVALESVRVLEWAFGELEELEGWELEITSLDWHERKAQRVNPAATGTGASASGRDQYGQRLEHNRERFLKEAGQLVAGRHGDRGWRQLVVVGEGDRPRLLAKGLGPLRDRVHEIPQDLIRAGAGEILRRIEAEQEHLNRAREERLVTKIEEAISATPRPALGPDEVLTALEQARAHHVIFDATRDWEKRDGMPISELIIERALATGADVTPAEGLAAAALGQRGGAAALLRY
ncbi:MAG: VLRF1 family aeRF1-type release factor [Solirubrobacterales bacterium]